MTRALAHMDNQETKPSLHQAWKHSRDAKSAFLFVDVFAGSAGVWIPFFVGLLHRDTTVAEELMKLFDSAGVYIFAIAFLAASSSFLYLDRRKNAVNEIREGYDRNAGWLAVGVIAVGMLLIGIQLSSTIPSHKPLTAKEANVTNTASATGQSFNGAPPRETIASCDEEKKTSSGGLVVAQALYLLAAGWLGYRLFCLRNISKIPGELERIKAVHAKQLEKNMAEAQNIRNF